MDATTIGQAVGQFKIAILDSIRHNTLLKYTGTPLLNEQQLFFLLFPKLNGEAWNDDMTKSAITVGIVHSSLAEHDKIHVTNAESKEQQLTVLSGDYYSGRYYQLLAQMENISLIHQLSKAIVARCEHEITIYEEQTRAFHEWIDSLMVIETALIERFYDVYGYDHYSDLMRQTLIVTRLKRELANLLQGQPSIYIERMQNSLLGQSMKEALEDEIKSRKQLLDVSMTASTVSEALKQRIIEMVS